MSDRAHELGFSPQKERIYNTFLPYSAKVDEESNNVWKEIKTNFCKSVLCQDLRDIRYWCDCIRWYFRFYKWKFSKADHIQIVKVCYELLIIPHLEFNIVRKLAYLLMDLLSKDHLLSRDDLSLPWRPLYELYESTFYTSVKSNAPVPKFVLLEGNFENDLKALIKYCSVYFPIESTQEILDEFRPWMCPFDTESVKAIDYFEMFFCTTLPPSEHDRGFKLWFDELMGLWLQWHSVPSWENSFLWLLARLAVDNTGYVNWEPYIPMMFTRLLRSFNLPGRKSMVQVIRGNAFDTDATSFLIASMLGGGSSCQLHLNRLFKALESFYHPSNHGRWLLKMLELLKKLPIAVSQRIHRERYKLESWKTPTPEAAKLREPDITDFVNCLKNATTLSMFSKRGCSYSAKALQHLAVLRPELVLPHLLEGLYSSLETLTEPHRLTAAMDCIVPVCRPLVKKNKYFSEGPRHVIPLLMAALPGIDPNDIKKCLMTFQFISVLGSLVLFVDCSSAVGKVDLPEHAQEVCLSTAAFEDFVLQFMDRLFLLIENSYMGNTSRLDRDLERTNPEENILQGALHSAFGMVIMHSSPAIYKAALSKLKSYVTSHIFEINVSGKYAANMCQCMTKINPELGLKAFVPHYTKLILALTDNEEIFKEEKLDDELLFSLLVLSEVVACDGKHLLEYQDSLIQVLERIFKLTCKEGYLLGCNLLKLMLKMYTSIYLLDMCNVADPWNRHSDEDLHLYIEDWGRSGDLDNVQVKYHYLTDEEIAAATVLLEKFLMSEIENLRECAAVKKTKSRESLHRSLNIILSCLIGAAASLPMWAEEQIPLETSLGLQLSFRLETGDRDININGRNVRQVVAETIRKLYEYITECCEDDTKGLFLIIKIYSALLIDWGMDRERIKSRLKYFGILKSILNNKLYGRKSHVRYILMDQINMVHEERTSGKFELFFTRTHKLLIEDLLSLSTSHYSEVRKSAQTIVSQCFTAFPAAYKCVSPKILQFLKKDPTEYHEEFKGVLHVIYGQRQRNFLLKQDWDLLVQMFPALVASKHSEKPSIIKLLDSISDYLQKHMPLIQIKVQIPERCLEAAKGLWTESDPPLSTSYFSEEEIQQFTEKQIALSEHREKQYYSLLQNLLDLIQSGSLHWRNQELAFVMLKILIRPDCPVPTEIVQLLVTNFNNDSLAIRKLSLKSLTYCLKQQKRKHPRITIVPQEQNPPQITLHPLMPQVEEGWAPDNYWLLYNSANNPDTYEKWNSRYFVTKAHWGFNSWPKEFKVYALDSDQPNLDRSLEDLKEEERPIYEAFMQQSFVDKLISFLSLEGKKDKDSYRVNVFHFFKSLFRNYGDAFLPLFIDHLNRMVVDKTESVQRCAAELLSGIIGGSKHWNFEKMEALKKWVLPLLEKIMSNVTPETIRDWNSAFNIMSQDQDPSRYYWLFEYFIKQPASVENGSFLESSWLTILSTLLVQQEWRVFELQHRALNLILPKLDHSYQNVSEKLGGFLGYIFLFDVPLDVKILDLAPSRKEFLKTVLPRFDMLLVNPEKDNSVCLPEESPQKKSVKNLFRTILRWISVNGSKSIYTAPPEIMDFLPLLWHMMNDATDESFQRECSIAQAILGQALLTKESISAAIKILQNVTSGNSWHSRVYASAYLQTMVFTNLFSVMSHEQWTKDIYDIVLKLLLDEHVEVRESAAETFCGFVHCEYFKLTDELLTFFKTKSKKKLNRRETASSNGLKVYDPEDIRVRHAGILGLCACVDAYPYDVPEFLPDILVLLGDHLNDPLPISATIKKTMSSFRRTHYDSWRDHKLKFTDDQLAVITDFLVSPSYYA